MDEIVKMRNISKIKPDIFSAYLFFPFAFDNSSIQMPKLARALQNDPLKNWRASDYEIKDGQDYNEYLYFYRYARDILFSSSQVEPKDFYFLQWQQKDLWLKIFGNDNNRALHIAVEGVYLHLYDFGVGILIFELNDPKPDKNLQDYIRILNLSRRLYPAFVDKRFDFSDPQAHLVAAINAGECPAKIQLLENQQVLVEHDFFRDNLWGMTETRRHIPTLSQLITYFLDVRRSGFTFTHDKEKYWSIVDDRMFVHSFYRLPLKDQIHNRIFVQSLKKFFDLNAEERYHFNEKSLDIWYQTIFLDSESPTCQNHLMMKEVLSQATYKRWSNYATFYGYSRFSSVMLVTTNEPENARDFSHVLHSHFHTMYYQIAVLLFFYRGALLAFSRRSAKIVKLFQKGIQKKGKQLLERLQKEFLLFRNRFWFKEVTAQDQGIEMFQKWAEQMNIFELMEDVKTEIRELYDYIEYKNEQRENRLLFIITLIGAFLLPVSVITGFLGMNILELDHTLHINPFDISGGWGWFWIPLIISYAIIFPIVFYYQLKKE
ncbi:CorA family divalent cation transporter [Calditrichota bacterium LG25]